MLKCSDINHESNRKYYLKLFKYQSYITHSCSKQCISRKHIQITSNEESTVHSNKTSTGFVQMSSVLEILPSQCKSCHDFRLIKSIQNGYQGTIDNQSTRLKIHLKVKPKISRNLICALVISPISFT